MKSIELSSREIVRMSRSIYVLSDAYDNMETCKDCYDLHSAFKKQAKELNIKSRMSDGECIFMCQISRDLRDERMNAIRNRHRDEEDEDED